MSETPITFDEPSYALFDVEKNAVRTTQWGNLAIFSVKSMAEQWAQTSGSKIRVVPVSIKPITEQ